MCRPWPRRCGASGPRWSVRPGSQRLTAPVLRVPAPVQRLLRPGPGPGVPAYSLAGGPLASSGRCGRSDSRAMAIVMAIARTARPASCPPIRRGFSGSGSEADVALIARERRWPGAARMTGRLVDGCGDTVGNRPAGLVRAAAESGAGGSGGSGGAGAGAGEVGVGEGEGETETILSEAAALPEVAPFAFAFAVSLTCRPAWAAFRTFTWTCSSSACLFGRFPRVQVDPLAFGQTENRGVPTCLSWRIAASTVTALALA